MANKIDKPIYIEVVLMRYDVKTKAGHIYTKECVHNIIRDFKLKHNSELFGEIDNPDRKEVSLGNISHRVIDMWIDEEKKCLKGMIKTMPGTPKGNVLQSQLLSFGGDKEFDNGFAIASRGMGVLNEDNTISDYKIVSFDIVTKKEDPYANVIRLE